jgi:pentose-5-phosphate-3-epimerase
MNMPQLSPSIVCYNGSFQETANLLGALGCRRAHIDVTAGYSIHGLFRYESFEIGDRLHFDMGVDLHIFDFRRQWEYQDLPLRENDCVIFHWFPWTNRHEVEKLLERGFPRGVRCGLALDLQASLSDILPLFPVIDTLMVMGIEIGGRGIPLNEKAILDLDQARTAALAADKEICLGIDGGVNAKTFAKLAKLADTLVVGGLLFNAPDIAAQWLELNRWLKEA